MDRLTVLLLFAIEMTVSIGSAGSADSSQSASCSDIATCTPNSNLLKESITNNQYQESCKILTRSYNCMKSAIEDCKARNDIMGESLQNMEKTYKEYEPQLAQYCQNPTGDVHCMDSTKCIPDTDGLVDATTNGRFDEACRILKTSDECLRSAVEDCKARGLMSENDTQNMEQIRASYQPQIKQLCKLGSPSTGGGVGCLQIQSCVPDSQKERMLEAMKNNDYKEACKIIKPALECQRSALKDCKDRGIMDSTTVQQIEQGMAPAQEMLKSHCSSGNSASTLRLSLTPLWIALISLIHFRM